MRRRKNPFREAPDLARNRKTPKRKGLDLACKRKTFERKGPDFACKRKTFERKGPDFARKAKSLARDCRNLGMPGCGAPHAKVFGSRATVLPLHATLFALRARSGALRCEGFSLAPGGFSLAGKGFPVAHKAFTLARACFRTECGTGPCARGFGGRADAVDDLGIRGWPPRPRPSMPSACPRWALLVQDAGVRRQARWFCLQIHGPDRLLPGHIQPSSSGSMRG